MSSPPQLRSLLLAAVLAQALRYDPDSAQLPASLSSSTNRQVMTNYEDVQYFISISIGGQSINGMVDTGSFDFVVFDRACKFCGTAANYSRAASGTYRGGALSRTLYYGSGSVDAREAFDWASLPPFDKVRLTFWDVTDAYMPVLNQAAFHSIIGMGPPETPASDAWAVVADAARHFRSQVASGGNFPRKSNYEALSKSVDFAVEIARRPPLLLAQHLTAFSICLGTKPNSSGFFTWNDTSFLDSPALFQRVPVLGRHTWALEMSSAMLSTPEMAWPIGCHDGCGVIIDSGTSLLIMPSESADKIEEVLAGTCSDLALLPNLMFEFGGSRFTLPPDAYLAKMTGGPNLTSISSFARVRRISHDCDLAVMESTSSTKWGPLWILGMPFFRSYYTSFNVGRTRHERALFIALADRDCFPLSNATFFSKPGRAQREHEVRTYDRTKIWLSPLASKALSEKYIDL